MSRTVRIIIFLIMAFFILSFFYGVGVVSDYLIAEDILDIYPNILKLVIIPFSCLCMAIGFIMLVFLTLWFIYLFYYIIMFLYYKVKIYINYLKYKS